MQREVVLLFHPRTFHERNYRYFHVPYSLLSVAANLDRTRFEVILIDNNVLAREDFSADVNRLRSRLLCVGISAMIGHQIADGLMFARTVRAINPQVPIVWGGAVGTVLTDLLVANELVDVVVRGQGQETLAELVDALAGERDLATVGGISYKDNATVVHNQSRPFTDLNRFAAASSAFHLVNLPDYIRFDEHVNSRMLSYHSSQGCPFNCGFCSETALWKNRWSGLGVERIVADVEALVDAFDINGVKFYDAEFFINQARAMGFGRAVVDRGLPIRWAASVHPRNVDRLSDDDLALLARSGASRFLMGAESGVEAELELVGKRTSRELLLRVAERCSAHNIVGSFSFVTGYPSMPSENMARTLEFAAELANVDPRHEAKVHLFAPYPGTPLYPLAVQAGFIPPASLEEWSTYDYYEVTTPWVDPQWGAVVRAFNEERCPYLKAPTNDAAEPVVKINALL